MQKKMLSGINQESFLNPIFHVYLFVYYVCLNNLHN
jgi:hypothetical protein